MKLDALGDYVSVISTTNDYTTDMTALNSPTQSDPDLEPIKLIPSSIPFKKPTKKIYIKLKEDSSRSALNLHAFVSLKEIAKIEKKKAKRHYSDNQHLLKAAQKQLRMISLPLDNHSFEHALAHLNALSCSIRSINTE